MGEERGVEIEVEADEDEGEGGFGLEGMVILLDRELGGLDVEIGEADARKSVRWNGWVVREQIWGAYAVLRNNEERLSLPAARNLRTRNPYTTRPNVDRARNDCLLKCPTLRNSSRSTVPLTATSQTRLSCRGSED